MSFNDLERGESSQPLLRRAGPQSGELEPITPHCQSPVAPLGSRSGLPTHPPRAISSTGSWSSSRLTEEDKAFATVKDSVSIQIFKIQSNVTGIQKLVDKLGKPGDGPALRTSLYVVLLSGSVLS